jgi:hypothetical protein
MRATNANVVEKDYTKTYKVNNLSIYLNYIELNQIAEFCVDEMDINGTIANRSYYRLTPEEYEQWGNDDDYVINLIITKYGYTKA